MRWCWMILVLLPLQLQAVTFKTVDVVIECGDAELTAWQAKLNYDRKTISIVGIEGADFDANPPQYDARGLQGGRIILAAFTTRKNGLASGNVRVARLHLQVADDAAVDFQSTLMAAAQPGGDRIKGRIFIEAVEQ